ncbi:MAG: Lpg1974 family pore-forming outer membrane protein, partial [Gemmataceae bacterium]
KIDTDSEYLSNGVTTATTVSPTVSFGYQFGSGRTVHFDYQYLTGSGRQAYPSRSLLTGLAVDDWLIYQDQPYVGRSRIDLHTFDFDVHFRDAAWSLIPFMKSRWGFGGRYLRLWSDTREPTTYNDRVQFEFRPSEWFGDERMTNTFQAFGPHLDYKIAIAIESIGFEVFALADASLLFGNRRVRYEPVDAQPIRNGRVVGVMESFLGGQLAAGRPPSEHSDSTAGVQWRGDLGAKWTFPFRNRLVTLSAGYRVDYLSMGSLSTGATTRSDSIFSGGSTLAPGFDLKTTGVFLACRVLF